MRVICCCTLRPHRGITRVHVAGLKRGVFWAVTLSRAAPASHYARSNVNVYVAATWLEAAGIGSEMNNGWHSRKTREYGDMG